MFDQVRAVPKPEKQAKKKKTGIKKVKPYNRKVITPKPKKKPKTKKEQKVIRDGLKIPDKKKRGDWSDFDREKALEVNGAQCKDPNCRLQAVNLHHAKFRSGDGRGKWRNAIPLCKKHHDQAHTLRKYADFLRSTLEAKYGPHYFKDEWDLWLAGLIQDPNKIDYEEFMKGEEERVRTKLAIRNEGKIHSR
jgi:hypothetical protein